MVRVGVWVEDHPYLTGFTVLALVILLFLIWRRRQQSTAAVTDAGGTYYAGPSEGVQVAGIQAGAQVQGMILAAQVADAQTAADVQKTYYAQQARLYELDTLRDVTVHQTDAQLELGLIQTAGQVALGGAQAQFGDLVFGGTDFSLTHQARATAGAQQSAVQQAIQSQAALPSGAPASSGAIVAAVGTGAAALPYGGTPGQTVHGVTETACDPGLDPACARANLAAVQASYDVHPGSYLGGGVYAGTPEATAIYGPGGTLANDYVPPGTRVIPSFSDPSNPLWQSVYGSQAA